MFAYLPFLSLPLTLCHLTCSCSLTAHSRRLFQNIKHVRFQSWTGTSLTDLIWRAFTHSDLFELPICVRSGAICLRLPTFVWDMTIELKFSWHQWGSRLFFLFPSSFSVLLFYLPVSLFASHSLCPSFSIPLLFVCSFFSRLPFPFLFLSYFPQQPFLFSSYSFNLFSLVLCLASSRPFSSSCILSHIWICPSLPFLISQTFLQHCASLSFITSLGSSPHLLYVSDTSLW